MRRISTIVFWLICGAALLAAQPSVERLQDVRTIFVNHFDSRNPEVANMVNAKLISYLAKYHGVSVVESEDKADAILTGSYQIQPVTNEYGHTRYHMQGQMRLDNKDGVVLWADDVSNSPFARSASSSFAENVAKKLVRAIFGEDRGK